MTSSRWRWLFLALIVLSNYLHLTKSQGIWTKYGCRVDICFVVDQSGSVGQENWQRVTNFLEKFVNELTISSKSTQVGLVTFGDFGELVFSLDDYNDDKDGMIETIASTGCCKSGTSIDDALDTARTECFRYGNRPDAPDVAVLITDGQSSFYEADKEARLLRESGVSIVVIGVGSSINKDLLSAIADDDDSVFLSTDFGDLLNDTSLILGRSCSAVESCSGGQISGWSESNFPLLLDCPRLSNPIVDGDIFKFECYINYSVPMAKQDDARFLVQFLHDGKLNDDYAVVLSAPETTATLHEYYLMGNMGKYLSCQVQTFWQSSIDVKSPPVSSRSYWTGITFSNEEITIYESDDDDSTEYDNVAQVYVYSSLPILCPEENSGRCELSLSVTSSGSVAVYQRHELKMKIRRCIYKLFEEDWKANESWAYSVKSPLQVAAMIKVVPVKIRHASITMTTRPSKRLLSTDLDHIPAGTEYSPWNGYQLPSLQVLVVGGKKRGKCSATGDPHITTFDGTLLDVYEKGSSGIYYLLISKRYNLKIQTYIEGLYSKQVAVNDGGLITIITLSDSIKCVQSNERTQVTSDGTNRIYVHTYSGVVVTVERNSHYLQIFIEVPSQFWKNTAGLCGSYDGNKTNDINIPGIPDVIKHYKIMSQEESFFKCPKSDYIPYEFCQCKDNTDRTNRARSNTKVCGLDDRSLDRLTPSYPVTLLLPRFVLTNNRQRPRTKREADDELYTDDVVQYEPPTVSDSYTPFGDPPTWGTHGITEAEARKQCTEAFSNSPSYSSCKPFVKEEEIANLIRNCMLDIQITGELSFALRTANVLRDVCYVNMINHAADNVTDPEEPLSDPQFMTLFASFLDTSCPNNCSGNGFCKQAVCQCHSGYEGVDCSLLKGTPPSNVQYLEEQFCDKAERPCRSIRLQADNIRTTNNVTCKFIIKFYNGSQKTLNNEGTIQSPGRVSCKLPNNLPAFFSFNVAISNDGKHFTEASQMYQNIDVGNSREMWPECVQQKIHRSKTATRILEKRCYVTEVSKEDEKRGMITTFRGLLIEEFASKEIDIKTSCIHLLNDYTKGKPNELCESVKLRQRQNIVRVQDSVFQLNDIRIADGYPEETSFQGSRVKWLVELPTDSVKDICVVDGQEEKLDVSGEFLKKAMAGLEDEVSKLTSKDIKVDYEVPDVKRTVEPKRSSAVRCQVLSSLITAVLVTTWRLARTDGWMDGLVTWI